MEQDLYGLQASGIDPEIAAQMLGLKRKRSVADALMQQALSPLKADRVAPGGLAVPISPWEGIAQLAKAYMGSKGLEDLDKQQGDLTRQNQAKVTEAISGYMQRRDGTPETQMTTAVDDEGNTNPMVAGRAPDMKEAIKFGLTNNLLQNSPLVKMDAAAFEKSQQPYTLTAGAQRFGPDNKPLAAAGFKPDRPRPPMTDFQIAQLKDMVMKADDMGMDSAGLRQELQMAIAGRDAIKSAQPAPAQPSAPSATANLPPEVVAAGLAGKPFVASQAPGQPVQFGAPPAAGLAPRDARAIQVDQAKKDIDLAGNQTERTNKQSFAMKGINAAIKEAEDLLDKNPTASGLGTIVDSVAGFFGKTMGGAEEAQALKVVGGVLTSKVPRFEGPQSDKDTATYKETAGMVGDSTVPVPLRKAALKKVKSLLATYENAPISPATNEATGTIRRDVPPDIANLLNTYGKPRG